MTVDISRAKRLDTGEWAYGYYVKLEIGGVERHYIVLQGSSEITKDTMVEIDNSTKGRCTGEPDKSGAVVFEGDILSGKTYDELVDSERLLGLDSIPEHIVTLCPSVYEGAPAFKVVSTDGRFYPDYMRSICERSVVGNIHECALT